MRRYSACDAESAAKLCERIAHTERTVKYMAENRVSPGTVPTWPEAIYISAACTGFAAFGTFLRFISVKDEMWTLKHKIADMHSKMNRL